MKVTLIHNPAAGEREHFNARELMAIVRKAGHKVAYRSSKDDDWQSTLDEPVDLVAVAGGDGTVAKIARNLAGRRIPIAILPLGTANNIARTLGLADTALEDLVGDWAKALRLKFDIAVADGPWGSRQFIEALGLGVFSSIMSRLAARDDIQLAHLQDPKEKMTEVQLTLKDHLSSYPAKKLRATLDGDDISNEYLLLEAMNIQHVGPNLRLAPKADPSDGLLDVVLVPERDRKKLSKCLLGFLQGKSTNSGLTVKRGKRLHIECEAADVHIDDKRWPREDADSAQGPTAIDVTIDRHALEFLLPIK